VGEYVTPAEVGLKVTGDLEGVLVGIAVGVLEEGA